LLVARYGDFELTEAIRPSLDVQVVPRQGFRVSRYQDTQGNIQVPALVAAVSRAQLFDLFLALLEPLGEVVDVVLETSHESDGPGHQDLLREHIDLPVLKSHFCEFEELLLNDGCTGVAVLATTGPMEVQFDEHKLLIVYAADVEPFEAILLQAGVRRNNRLKLITEGEHLHCSEARHVEAFAQLCCRLGVGEAAERVNW
jgi:hypothetical protein